MARGAGIAIGDLARRTGVHIETIRYFERVGMLPQPSRTSGGRRRYDSKHVRLPGFIQRARALGVSPAEVKALLALGGPGIANCGEVGNLASLHLARVHAKMADLAHLEAVLASAMARCSGDAVPECAIIEMLDQPLPRARPQR